MLNLCVKYFSRHGIKISVDADIDKSKTKCLAFNVAFDPINLELYDLVLPWVDSAVHLGHLLNSGNIEDTSKFIMSRRGEFNSLAKLMNCNKN